MTTLRRSDEQHSTIMARRDISFYRDAIVSACRNASLLRLKPHALLGCSVGDIPPCCYHRAKYVDKSAQKYAGATYLKSRYDEPVWAVHPTHGVDEEDEDAPKRHGLEPSRRPVRETDADRDLACPSAARAPSARDKPDVCSWSQQVSANGGEEKAGSHA